MEKFFCNLVYSAPQIGQSRKSSSTWAVLPLFRGQNLVEQLCVVPTLTCNSNHLIVIVSSKTSFGEKSLLDTCLVQEIVGFRQENHIPRVRTFFIISLSQTPDFYSIKCVGKHPFLKNCIVISTLRSLHRSGFVEAGPALVFLFCILSPGNDHSSYWYCILSIRSLTLSRVPFDSKKTGKVSHASNMFTFPALL